MKGKIKTLSTVVDYCCFILSIALSRLHIDLDNINVQWSSAALCSKLNDLPFTENSNFYLNSTALSHGLLLFQKALRYYGIQTVQIFQENKSVRPFFSEEYSRMSIEFKCSTFTFPPTEAKDLLSCILRVRNFLLEKLNYQNSERSSPSEVFGVLYLQLPASATPGKDEVSEVSTNMKTSSFNLRKSPSSLSSRSISNISKKVIVSVEEKVGVENSLFFLKSAVKVLYKKRKSDDSESEGEEIEPEEEQDFNSDIIQEESVQSFIAKMPTKNIILTKEDKSQILGLFDVIKEAVIEKGSVNINTTAASITKRVLIKKPYYSNIKTKDIKRWCSKREKKRERGGRKINGIFESEVWGNLVLGIFESSEGVTENEVN